MNVTRVPLGRPAVHEGKSRHRYEADVVVVGGAVAGASMAHALAEYGISSIVLERGDSWPEINRGDALQPLTLGFFERWDVLRHMEELGAYPIKEWEFVNPRIGHLGT